MHYAGSMSIPQISFFLPEHKVAFRDNASTRLYLNKRPGALVSAKKGKVRSKRPLSKRKCEKCPRHTVDAPLIIFGGKRPGAELASNLSVGHGAVSEAGKGVLYIAKFVRG